MPISQERELDLVVERLEGARFVLLHRVGITRRAGRSTSRRSIETHASLTPREERVLALVSDGLHSAEIASDLGLAATTIDDTIESARVKLGARTRIQAAVIARTRPAIRPEEVGTLHPEAAALLAALAEGDSIDSAARRVGLSRRTAHRRLERAREVLGVRSNAAAVARFSGIETDGTR